MMRCKPLPLRPKGGMLLLAALVLLLVAVLDPSSSAGQGAASAPADKTELLQRKLAAMEELRGRIGLKLIEASGLRDSLTSRIVPLELELQTLAAQHHCSTFAQTAEHPQIHFGLKTLAYLYGYREALQAALGRLREADHTLQYLHQQVVDDLAVIATLNDFTIDALVTRIDRALDFPEALQAHLIDAARVQPPEPAAVFSRIIPGP